MAFLFGWQRFIVAGSASIATLGAGLAIFLSTFLPLNAVWVARDFQLLGQTVHWQYGAKQCVAVAAIFIMSAINCLTILVGGKVQLVLTLLKTGGIALVIVGVFVASSSADWSNLATPEGKCSVVWTVGVWSRHVGCAVGYDGWNNMRWRPARCAIQVAISPWP